MSESGHDIQICVCKTLKLLSQTCLAFSLKHPILSLSTLCMLLLYVVFPFAFWVLVYSVPLVVCTGILLAFSFNAGSAKRPADGGEAGDSGRHGGQTQDSTDGKSKRPITRVHSVRRRRAKECARGEEYDNMQQQVVEDETGVQSTNFNHDMVNNDAALSLTKEENSPKEIREVEVVLVSGPKSSYLWDLQSTKHEFDESGCHFREEGKEDGTKSASLCDLQSTKHEFDESGCHFREEGKEDGIDKSNNYNIIDNVAMLENEEDDHQKNKMDVVISDSERTKRLESLIARRRSRKLLSLEVRRSLMNKARNQDYQVSSIALPKINNMNRLVIPSRVVGGGPPSPIPGSAPTVLMPMRNPFDLPYDPQEEKPDLTGDSFEQEFMPASNRDIMKFCRHESFSLRPFLPGEFNREISSSFSDSRIRQRASCSLGHQFSMPAAGKELVSESSKPIVNHPDEDHIKEIIQVHENSSEDGDFNDEVRTRDALQEEDNSSEEDAPVFNIDGETILKSLSPKARQSPLQEETENTDIDNSDDQLGDLSRLKDRFYYTDRTTTTRRHAASNSVASDMQVEVSELSSPPLTIDENLSYVYNDDDNPSTYDADSWAGSSHFDFSQVDDYESRLAQVDEISERVGSSRGDVPEDTTMSNESQCDHPWCSIAEYHTNCRTTRATNLDEKIDKTLQRSVSLVAQSSSRDDSMKPEECSHRLNKSEESNTLDAVTGSALLHEINRNTVEDTPTVEMTIGEGRVSNERYDMEHVAAQSVSPFEDSEETRHPEHQERIMASTVVEDQVNIGSTQHSEGDQSSGEGTSITHSALGSSSDLGQPSNLMPNAAFELVQSSPSPNSVLHPTCSLASFENYIDDEVHPLNERAVRVLSPVAHHDSANLPTIDGELQHESPEPSNTSTTEVNDEESAKQDEIHENGIIPDEAASGSSQVHSRHEEEAERTEEISSASFITDAGTENLSAFSHSTDHSNDSVPPLSADEEEQSRRQEIGIGESSEDKR